MRWLLVFLVGCAQAGSPGQGTIDSNTGGGGSDGNQITLDGAIDTPPPIDAAITKTLSQNNSTAVVATQIGCQQTNPATGYTAENSYYRVFPLSDSQVTTPFHVTQVTFAVELANAPAGNQPAQVKLGTYAGTIGATTLNLAQVTSLGTAAIMIPNGATSVVTPISAFTPSSITVPANANLIVEVFIPNGQSSSIKFFIGSNNGGETRPSYIRAPDCSVATPSSYASIGQPANQLVLSVTGTI